LGGLPPGARQRLNGPIDVRHPDAHCPARRLPPLGEAGGLLVLQPYFGGRVRLSSPCLGQHVPRKNVSRDRNRGFSRPLSLSVKPPEGSIPLSRHILNQFQGEIHIFLRSKSAGFTLESVLGSSPCLGQHVPRKNVSRDRNRGFSRSLSLSVKPPEGSILLSRHVLGSRSDGQFPAFSNHQRSVSRWQTRCFSPNNGRQHDKYGCSIRELQPVSQANGPTGGASHPAAQTSTAS